MSGRPPDTRARRVRCRTSSRPAAVFERRVDHQHGRRKALDGLGHLAAEDRVVVEGRHAQRISTWRRLSISGASEAQRRSGIRFPSSNSRIPPRSIALTTREARYSMRCSPVRTGVIRKPSGRAAATSAARVSRTFRHSSSKLVKRCRRVGNSSVWAITGAPKESGTCWI